MYSFFINSSEYSSDKWTLLRNNSDVEEYFKDRTSIEESFKQFFNNFKKTYPKYIKENKNIVSSVEALTAFKNEIEHSTSGEYGYVPALLFKIMSEIESLKRMLPLTYNIMLEYVQENNPRVIIESYISKGRCALINKRGGYFPFDPKDILIKSGTYKGPYDNRNSKHIVFKAKDGETTKEILCPEFNWHDMQASEHYEEDNKLIVAETPGEFGMDYDWYYAVVRCEDISNKEMYLKSHLIPRVGRFNKAYETLFNILMKQSDLWNAQYLFYNMDIYRNLKECAWILEDGSLICCSFGWHRFIVENILELKEQEIEHKWVKVSGHGGKFRIFTHPNMTKAQERRVEDLTSKYGSCVTLDNILFERRKKSI